MGQAFVRGADFEVWEYEHSQDQWCPFRAEDQQRLLKQFAQYNAGSKDAAKFCLKLGEFEYEVDIEIMRQTNRKTRKQRQIRRTTLRKADPATKLGDPAYAELQTLQIECSRKTAEIESLKSQLDSEIESAKQRISGLQAENDRQRDSIENVTKEKDNMQLELHAAIENVTRERDNVQLQLQAANELTSALQLRLQAANDKLAALQAQNDKQRDAIENVTKQKDEVQVQLQAASELTSVLQSEIEGLKNQTQLRQTALETEKRKVAQLQQAQDDMATQLEEARAKVDDAFKSLLVQHLTDPLTYACKEVSPLDPVCQAVRDFATSTLVQHRRAHNANEWCPVAKLCHFRIERLHNRTLHDKYLAEIDHLTHIRGRDRVNPILDLADGSTRPFFDLKSKDTSLNEVFLFHGASSEVIEKIMLEGFDPQRGGEAAGAMFGIGAYFARNLSKCDFYARGNRRRHVLLSRVLLGHPYVAKQSLGQQVRRPPDGPSGEACDSVMALTRAEGGVVDHREYVIFERSRALPLFRISYEHEADCKCHMCSYRP